MRGFRPDNEPQVSQQRSLARPKLYRTRSVHQVCTTCDFHTPGFSDQHIPQIGNKSDSFHPITRNVCQDLPRLNGGQSAITCEGILVAPARGVMSTATGKNKLLRGDVSTSDASCAFDKFNLFAANVYRMYNERVVLRVQSS